MEQILCLIFYVHGLDNFDGNYYGPSGAQVNLV